MKRYHPESSLSAEEKLRRVAATVGLSMPKKVNPENIESSDLKSISSVN